RGSAGARLDEHVHPSVVGLQERDVGSIGRQLKARALRIPEEISNWYPLGVLRGNGHRDESLLHCRGDKRDDGVKMMKAAGLECGGGVSSAASICSSVADRHPMQRLDMDLGAVDDREPAVLAGEGEEQVGAAEKHGLGALIPAQLLPGREEDASLLLG